MCNQQSQRMEAKVMALGNYVLVSEDAVLLYTHCSLPPSPWLTAAAAAANLTGPPTTISPHLSTSPAINTLTISPVVQQS
ncbi:hypothetical protein GW17_00001564 [Ensete ventricosum]|nr:hypothetical protein GW17_00001564 [Ensete ventricosum]